MSGGVKRLFRKTTQPAALENRLESENSLNHYLAGSAQSVGKLRDHNEDALFSFTSTIADCEGELPLGLYIIADGMGGHRYGEDASSVAIRVTSKFILTNLYERSLVSQSPLDTAAIPPILVNAVEEAHKAVQQKAPGGGTTLTIALLIRETLITAHVGDSRAYYFSPDDHVQKLTRDDSLVQRLVDLKEISPSQAENHPQKNVLLKAVGQPNSISPEIQSRQVLKGAKVLLCSDGLWGVVSEKKLTDIASHGENPFQVCEQLVQEANIAGGPDNISVILVNVL